MIAGLRSEYKGVPGELALQQKIYFLSGQRAISSHQTSDNTASISYWRRLCLHVIIMQSPER